MGCLCAGGDENNRDIDKYMDGAENDDGRIFKLLLLGPGSTGKSTLFKSLKISHSGAIQVKEKKSILHFMRQNIVNGICTLLEQSETLYEKNPNLHKSCKIFDLTMELQRKIELVTTYHHHTGFVDETKLNYEELKELAESIDFIWKLDAIQATFNSRGNNYVFDDNLDYFFNKATEVMTYGYIPSDQDCLKNRIKTTGMTQYEYQPDNKSHNRFKIVDVGGQRAERAKWINYFDNVHGLLFVASLIDYNAVLYEDDTTNSMCESTQLFGTTTTNNTFKDCALILILNKDDLLQKLLCSENNGLSSCFSKEGKWPDENEYWDVAIDEQYRNNVISFDEYHEIVIDFVAELFEKRNQLRTKIYRHVTVALENKIVSHVFQDIQAIMVKQAMKQSGYWTEDV